MNAREMRLLLQEYRLLRNRLRWHETGHELSRTYDDTLVRVTGLAALARLEKPTGQDGADWEELRQLTYATLLKFVSALEQAAGDADTDRLEED